MWQCIPCTHYLLYSSIRFLYLLCSQIHNNAAGIVKSYSFLKLPEVDTLQKSAGKLAQELRLVANMLTEQILFTCVSNAKLKGSAAEIIRQQMTEIQARNAESEILPVLLEKAKAFLTE